MNTTHFDPTAAFGLSPFITHGRDQHDFSVFEQQDQTIFRTGIPTLDQYLGGGIRGGSIVVMVGVTGSGTACLTNTIIKSQPNLKTRHERAKSFHVRIQQKLYSTHAAFLSMEPLELNRSLLQVRRAKLSSNEIDISCTNFRHRLPRVDNVPEQQRQSILNQSWMPQADLVIWLSQGREFNAGIRGAEVLKCRQPTNPNMQGPCKFVMSVQTGELPFFKEVTPVPQLEGSATYDFATYDFAPYTLNQG